ncbi:hypothetical protein KUF71_014127 [Frankliniella fusca]|uniref:Uncharacterized protein n=1 Tax=Frankliniella fusca TaxID=407009 RepID=A0AAE1LN71_9NEOP|nr:hypothetical protein KUF71_014127 [Frankliniella fusca]
MAECMKRSYDCVDGGRMPKFPRLAVANIRLESESEFSECDSESALSFQMHDTASVMKLVILIPWDGTENFDISSSELV